MTAEHIRALNAIGFDWGTSKTALAAIWNEQFEQLCEYKAKFGDCLVSQRYAADRKFGRWVESQHRNYMLCQDGKQNSMTAVRIPELESIEFKWKRNSVPWNEQSVVCSI